ncbi:T9SS type A sorting domain-containing protein [Polaribacter sp.]|uniref:T9SS type A sorting domain-containing protein n=1 Tax=Polaribacter sp. TaxID=1920175 RepID=UPI003EFA0845
MKKKILSTLLLVAVVGVYFVTKQDSTQTKEKSYIVTPEGVIKPIDKTKNKRQLYSIERELYEFNMQKNPVTGIIPIEEKKKEYEVALNIKQKAGLQRETTSTYVSRGPSNLGGRTRAFAVDVSDPTSNTMLSGGISSGLFRSTNGGADWTKVSNPTEVHNVSCIAQDTRTGFENIWYYGTGEFSGNSASLGSSYRGHGVYKSTNSGLTWTKLPATDSSFTSFDSYFDYINAMKVNPITGDLIIATSGRIYRYDGTNMNIELSLTGGNVDWTDVIVTTSGKVYAAFDGGSTLEGVWYSPTGNGSWTQIAKNGTPTDWAATGRIVLAEAPSSDGTIYALYANGNTGIEADLWKYEPFLGTWVNYSAKLPDEPGGDTSGNDPFAIQGGYDLVITVKPDNPNFLVIGGTNVYKIADITVDPTFTRIGGYLNNTGYAQYNVGGVTHHSDIHSLEFDPNNNNLLYSGTDGGIHKTADINAASIPWESLNNNYITYQYYHVAIDPLTGSNFVIGGAQDNGTTMGGTDAGLPDNTTMNNIFSGDGVAVGIARRDADANLQLFVGVQQGRIWSNYPAGYTEITPTGAPSGAAAQFITYYYLDPDNNDNLYYAGKNTLYTTATAAAITAATWVNAGSLSTGENLRTFATTRGTYDPFTSLLLIGGESGGIFKKSNPAGTADISTAINITPTGASTTDGTVVSGIAIHPTNPDIALAVYANYGIDNIFITTNLTSATPTWTMVERNLSAHSIRSAAIATVGEEIVYFVGTARGLYSSTDPTSTDWDMEGANSIGLSIVSSMVYRTSDKKLLIGTHGNGMFETTVEGTLAANNYEKNSLAVSLYPNPTQSVLNLKSSLVDVSKNVNYSIADINGKTVKQGLTNGSKVNVENLKSGVYIINLHADGKKQTAKFVKN